MCKLQTCSRNGTIAVKAAAVVGCRMPLVLACVTSYDRSEIIIATSSLTKGTLAWVYARARARAIARFQAGQVKRDSCAFIVAFDARGGETVLRILA